MLSFYSSLEGAMKLKFASFSSPWDILFISEDSVSGRNPKTTIRLQDYHSFRYSTSGGFKSAMVCKRCAMDSAALELTPLPIKEASIPAHPDMNDHST